MVLITDRGLALRVNFGKQKLLSISSMRDLKQENRDMKIIKGLERLQTWL